MYKTLTEKTYNIHQQMTNIALLATDIIQAHTLCVGVKLDFWHQTLYFKWESDEKLQHKKKL